MRERSRIIAALDIGIERASKICGQIGDLIDGVKVGYPLVLSSGIGCITELSKSCPVIADFKVADIPYVSEMICSRAFEAGACAVIVHGFVGRESVRKCVEVADRFDGKIFVVAEMTHPGAELLENLSSRIVEIARESGAYGIVAPATKPERIRYLKEISHPLKLLCPGVGAQGGDAKKAIESGADWIVVGRRIYNSPDPRGEVLKIMEEMG